MTMLDVGYGIRLFCSKVYEVCEELIYIVRLVIYSLLHFFLFVVNIAFIIGCIITFFGWKNHTDIQTGLFFIIFAFGYYVLMAIINPRD